MNFFKGDEPDTICLAEVPESALNHVASENIGRDEDDSSAARAGCGCGRPSNDSGSAKLVSELGAKLVDQSNERQDVDCDLKARTEGVGSNVHDGGLARASAFDDNDVLDGVSDECSCHGLCFGTEFSAA